MKRSIEQAQKRLSDELLPRGGVSGVGVGAHKGEPCLKVYVAGPGRGKAIPNRYDGHPVLVVGGGPFQALDNDGGKTK